MTLGDSCFGVGLTTLGALRIADIKRRAVDPQAASTTTHPGRPRRAYAALPRVRVSAWRHPVLTSLPHVMPSHQTLLHRSTPANRHHDPHTHPRNLRARSCPRRPGHRSRTRKCPSRASCCIDRHASAARLCHALRAQRALQHRRPGYNILWLGPSIIVKSR